MKLNKMAQGKTQTSKFGLKMRNLNVLSHGIYTNSHHMTNYFHTMDDTVTFVIT
jgi:hypothetical protein